MCETHSHFFHFAPQVQNELPVQNPISERAGVTRLHWLIPAGAQSDHEVCADRLGASIEFTVIPARAQRTRVGNEQMNSTRSSSDLCVNSAIGSQHTQDSESWPIGILGPTPPKGGKACRSARAGFEPGEFRLSLSRREPNR